MHNQKLSNPITLRLPSDVLDGIEDIAALTGRSRSWVMVRALKAYLAGEGSDIREIHAARQAIASGEGADLDTVLGDVERLLADDAA